jgi:hypothetical protein
VCLRHGSRAEGKIEDARRADDKAAYQARLKGIQNRNAQNKGWGELEEEEEDPLG